MSTTLLTAGLGCIIAAIVGGGLKGFGIEFPALQSGKRQLLLSIFGIVLLIGAFAVPAESKSDSSAGAAPATAAPAPAAAVATPAAPAVPDRQKLQAELEQNKKKLETLEQNVAARTAQIADQEKEIASQDQQIADGKITGAAVPKMQAEINKARKMLNDERKANINAQQGIARTQQRNMEIERLRSTN